MISAHWEAPLPTVQTSIRPPMLYDYDGFPQAAYEIQWPAPGAPEVAAKVRQALSDAGIESAEDGERGYDHGTFVVTKLMFPEPPYPPTLQLSLTDDLDPDRALQIGRALAGLRDSCVFIVGSGYSYHNTEGLGAALFGNPLPGPCKEFTAWLDETVMLQPDERNRRLAAWEQAPSARESHPREEPSTTDGVRWSGHRGRLRRTIPLQHVRPQLHLCTIR